ncbi:hypothetical protein GCM10017744_057020 [Streptomyces antimycoticus]|uniref:Uncharacterized protein n=1 Tax=Streptomyces antimycoticus TaxID=68175 RepID=A0A4D4K672_9ACTN|nr:hypothetical protein SANT12839_045240 [Streptomyces antimycoticus]
MLVPRTWIPVRTNQGGAVENVSTTEIPAGVELDFTAWLRHLERRDLSDPAQFAAVVRELALDPHRTEYAEYIGSRQSLMSDAGARWASLVAMLINAVHSTMAETP